MRRTEASEHGWKPRPPADVLSSSQSQTPRLQGGVLELGDELLPAAGISPMGHAAEADEISGERGLRAERGGEELTKRSRRED